MKNLFLSIIAVISFGFGAQALAQERPTTIKVGDTRTYELKSPRGVLIDTFNVVVTELTPSGGHTIKRTSNTRGEEVVSFTPNLGQDTDVKGNKGDGNLYDFPLTPGKSWSSKSFWLSDQGGVGYDEMKYTVEGETDITTPAGTFHVTKVVGRGNWRMGSWGNSIESVTYFSSEVKSHVRIERGRRTSSGFLEATVLELTSYKHAD